MIFMILILAALVGGFIAHSKGKNLFFWTITCGIFPPALIVLMLIPDKKMQSGDKEQMYEYDMEKWKPLIKLDKNIAAAIEKTKEKGPDQ